MKYSFQILLLLCLLSPTLAYAHGEEILYTVFLAVGSLLVFLIAAVLLPLPAAEKAVLVGVYLASLAVAAYCTSQLPYGLNSKSLNTVIVFAPVVACTVAFLVLRTRRNHRKLQE